MILTYGLTIIIAMVWAWRMISEKRLIWKRTPFLWFLVAWLVSQVLSTIFSIDPHTSIFGYYSRFHGGLLSSVAYATLFMAAVSNFDRSDVKPLLKSLLFGSLGVVLYAVPEHFGVSPSCVLINGQFTTECWATNTNPHARIFGTFGQPNWLAAYLIMTIPLALAWLTETWKKITQKIQTSWLPLGMAGITLLLSVLAVLYTGSRSGWLGLGLALAILFIGWLFILIRQHFNQTELLPHALRPLARHWTAVPLWLLVGIGLIFGIVGTPYTPSFKQLLARSTTTPVSLPPTPAATPPATGTVLENGGTDSGKIRAIVWRGALKVWERYPLLGSGVETFAYSYYRDRPVEHNLVSEWDFLYNKAHN